MIIAHNGRSLQSGHSRTGTLGELGQFTRSNPDYVVPSSRRGGSVAIACPEICAVEPPELDLRSHRNVTARRPGDLFGRRILPLGRVTRSVVRCRTRGQGQWVIC
jgi:hypothetical protein